MEPKDPKTLLKTGRRDAAGQSTRAAPTKTVVVVPVRTGTPQANGEPAPERSPEAKLAEAVGLAKAIDLDVVATLIVKLPAPRPATLLGAGKVDEIKIEVASREAGLAIVDHALTPVQQRNLEKAWNAKVLDRTGLILEIFGARAHTREGRLQVELAHLKYQKSRLVRSWTHLERQRGGTGFLGGPGETQIEQDRRLIQERIIRIERELADVRRTRTLQRRKRQKVPYPVVALVGYTNAGKSTLFNRLTQAEVRAEDLLFATLDPTLRRLDLPHGGAAILSDTVGFVSDLPTLLVAAFRATLEEVMEADLVLHIRDVAHEDSAAQAADVRAVLRDLDVAVDDPDKVLEVWNKIDLLDPERRARLAETARSGEGGPVLISAATGEGIDRLIAEIERRLVADRRVFSVELTPSDGETLAWIYRSGEVLERRDAPDLIRLQVRVEPQHAAAFRRRLRGAVRTER